MKRGILHRITVILLVFSMVMTGFPVFGRDVFAANNTIGTLKTSYSNKSYTDYNTLINDLSRMSNLSVEVDMLSDWDAASESMFDNYLQIPKGSRARTG